MQHSSGKKISLWTLRFKVAPSLCVYIYVYSEDEIHFTFVCLLSNDKRIYTRTCLKSMPLMLDADMSSHLMKLIHREALNFIEHKRHKKHK